MQGVSPDDHPRTFVQRIVSGGQTGADQAALDAAIALDIPHGGWVPRGRWTEVGPLPARYDVIETTSPEPMQRTEWNVRDADATLVCSHGPLTGGSALTVDFARRHRKPTLHVDFAAMPDAAAQVRAWLAAVRPRVLNVAGPRASNDGAIYDKVMHLLTEVFATR